ncbi:hypothetical protein HED60_13420 [Planctomycetales bacterium ZRK34]|nr:hypothetical protein HED60_13420 [Planctomycetales bacterium ZRK34]
MIWNPPFNALIMLVLIVGAAVLIALSYLWSAQKMKYAAPQAIATLVLRGLGFLLLILFVLQPMQLPKPREITMQRSVAVLLDTSASMKQPVNSAPSAPTRFGHVRKLLDDNHVFKQIQSQAQLNIYGFDQQAGALAADALAKYEPQGKQTDLAAAIRQVAKIHDNDDLAGVLVFSDGRNTQGSDPAASLGEMKLPVYTVAVGSVLLKEETKTEQKKDLAIESIAADRRVILGRTANIALTVEATGFGARQVTVELLKGDTDQVINTTAVAVSQQQSRRQALFTVKPSAVGVFKYRVRIPAEAEDSDPTNNQRDFEVEVVDPINRLLYVDRLRFERRFFNQILEKQRSLRYTSVVPIDGERVMVQGNDPDGKRFGAAFSPEQLVGLKAIVIGDVPASQFTGQQIAALYDWVDKGGALLIMGGPASLGDKGFAGTQLGKLLPITPAQSHAYLEGQYPVDLTAEGAAHPAFQKVKGRWGNAPPLLSRFAVAKVKPTATVLMMTTDTNAAPIVVAQNLGKGKTAVVLTDSTWRWSLGYDQRTQSVGGQSPHTAFWSQLVDWLLPELTDTDRGQNQVQIITDRQAYEVGDQVMLMISVRDAAGEVVRDAEVQVTAATPDGRPVQRVAKIDPSDTAGALYTASFEAYMPGEFTIGVAAKRETADLGSDRVSIQVTQPIVEFTQTDPDPQTLTKLAEKTGGSVLNEMQLGDLAAKINMTPRQVTIQPSADADAEPAWNRWLLLLAFIGLMSGEWFIRRKNQWV